VKKFRDVLVVLNPRTIPECMAAFESLWIPRIHIIEHTERQIMDDAFPQILAETDADWIWVVSDDAIVRQPAIEAVRTLARKHPVVTGYSQRTHDDWVVNLTKEPLYGSQPAVDAYEFYEFHEVVSWKTPVVPTYFAGMSLTGMSVEMWREYPFQCFGGPRDTGYSSDFSLSERLQRAGVAIVAARDAFCYHWRWDWITTNGIEDMKPRFDNPRVEQRA
jgi:GT2 family glycosyltransferase